MYVVDSVVFVVSIIINSNSPTGKRALFLVLIVFNSCFSKLVAYTYKEEPEKMKSSV